MRYQVTAHIFEDDDTLLKAVRFELDAGSLFLAQDLAEVMLERDYPDNGIEAEVEQCGPQD